MSALVLSVVLLLCLPVLRAWLLEKRERVSAGRIFKYRRFLTPEQKERRQRCLRRYAQFSIASDDDIGVVIDDLPFGRARTLTCDVKPDYSLSRDFLSDGVPRNPDPLTIWREEFKVFLINSGLRVGDYERRLTVYLVDEEDEPGLQILLRQTDRAIRRNPSLYWERMVSYI